MKSENLIDKIINLLQSLDKEDHTQTERTILRECLTFCKRESEIPNYKGIEPFDQRHLDDDF